MIDEFLLHSFDIAKIPYKKDFPLAQKSTFKIGSTTDLFIRPESPEQFQSVVAASKAADEKFFILGGGSNIVFPDQPYQGIIISTEKLNNILMTDDEIQPAPGDFLAQGNSLAQGDSPSPVDCPPQKNNLALVTCQAGTPMSAFVSFCTKHNLSGAEEFAGLPGTVGGAVYMNARCFEKSISDILYQTSFFTLQKGGKTKNFTENFDASQWAYKKSPFQTPSPESAPNPEQEQKIILSATFVLTKKSPADHEKIESDCKKFIAQRLDKGHFKFPSAGSVFKNNHDFGKPSGKLIDECGLKGLQIGGAQIAPFHGNFIINVDHAKAQDVEALVEVAKSKVKEKFNFDLEPEIIFLKN